MGQFPDGHWPVRVNEVGKIKAGTEAAVSVAAATMADEGSAVGSVDNARERIKGQQKLIGKRFMGFQHGLSVG